MIYLNPQKSNFPVRISMVVERSQNYRKVGHSSKTHPVISATASAKVDYSGNPDEFLNLNYPV